MPKMSSTDATIHASRDLIHAIQNTAPEIPLFKIGNSHKEALIYLAEILGKTSSPEVPQRVPFRGSYQ